MVNHACLDDVPLRIFRKSSKLPCSMAGPCSICGCSFSVFPSWLQEVGFFTCLSTTISSLLIFNIQFTSYQLKQENTQRRQHQERSICPTNLPSLFALCTLSMAAFSVTSKNKQPLLSPQIFIDTMHPKGPSKLVSSITSKGEWQFWNTIISITSLFWVEMKEIE